MSDAWKARLNLNDDSLGFDENVVLDASSWS